MTKSSQIVDNSTIFDERIAELETQKANLSQELAKLKEGWVPTSLPGGEQAHINVTGYAPDKLGQFLAQQNPVGMKLIEGLQKRQELKRELGLEAPPVQGGGVLGWHNRLVRWFKDKNGLVGALLGSRWWIGMGVILMVFWIGPVILYGVTGGGMGGVTPPKTKSVPVRVTPGVGDGLILFNADGNDEETPVPPTPTPVRIGGSAADEGGLNGPHGTFLAPSRLAIPALKVNANIERVLTLEGQTTGSVQIVWPKGTGVGHFGAYPGEIGNMLLFGTQESLGELRKVQQNDLLSVYDRNGNLFRYRVLAFSPSGQTERVIDLANPADGWVWEQTGEAVLTILVNPPRETEAKDDYLTTRKLAYRAVLANYAPTTVTPVGIAVGVPGSVWQVSPAPPTPTISPTPVTTTPENTTVVPVLTPTPTPALPGLPNTGDGWCYYHRC